MRKLVLLAVAAMAALAFAAPSASAAPVEMEWHPTGMMCSTQPGGFCRAHMVAEPVTLTRHTIIGEIDFICRVETDVHVFNNGTATLENEDLVDHPAGTGSCEDLVECNSPTSPTNWFISITHSGPQEAFSAHFCVDPPIVAACEGTVSGPITHAAQGAEERYETHLDDVDMTLDNGATTPCEFTGEFTIENVGGVPPIEIHHL